MNVTCEVETKPRENTVFPFKVTRTKSAVFTDDDALLLNSEPYDEHRDTLMRQKTDAIANVTIKETKSEQPNGLTHALFIRIQRVQVNNAYRAIKTAILFAIQKKYKRIELPIIITHVDSEPDHEHEDAVTMRRALVKLTQEFKYISLDVVIRLTPRQAYFADWLTDTKEETK